MKSTPLTPPIWGCGPPIWCEVTGAAGAAILRALVTDRVRPGEVFAPMHWTEQTAPCGRIGALGPAATDPMSGQPDLKAGQVSLDPLWCQMVRLCGGGGRVYPIQRLLGAGAVRCGLAGGTGRYRGARRLGGLRAHTFRGGPGDATAVSVIDRSRGVARVALMQDGRLIGALFAGREPVAVARDHLAGLPGGTAALAGQVLAGRPSADQPDPGPTLCACFGVGVNTILAAIRDRNLHSVADIGAALNAGTNCGSCRPELSALLARLPMREAAE